jgi:hypothetical protein
MATGDERDAGAGGGISVGGNVTGSSVASGRNITATVTFGGHDAEERRRVLEALAAIQAELARLPGPGSPHRTGGKTRFPCHCG